MSARTPVHVSKTDALVARLYAKIDTSGGANACWLWTGAKSKKKLSLYGCIWIGGGRGRNFPAHSVALALSLDGIIPADVECCHRCDVTLCCNPAHLFWGSHSVNMLDWSEKRKRRGLRLPRAMTSTLHEHVIADVD